MLNRKRVRLSLALLPLAGGLVYALCHGGAEDPVHEGRSYSERLYGTAEGRKEAMTAIGTNALPFLITELQASDSTLKTQLRRSMDKIERAVGK